MEARCDKVWHAAGIASEHYPKREVVEVGVNNASTPLALLLLTLSMLSSCLSYLPYFL